MKVTGTDGEGCTRADLEDPRCFPARPLRGSPSQAAPLPVARKRGPAQPGRASFIGSAVL